MVDQIDNLIPLFWMNTKHHIGSSLNERLRQEAKMRELRQLMEMGENEELKEGTDVDELLKAKRRELKEKQKKQSNIQKLD